jgi:hypothetical protein
MPKPINQHGKVPETSKSEQKELYSRELDSAKNSVETASGDIIKDNIPNYNARLQTANSFSSLKGRITRNLSNKSAGKTDHVTEKYVFTNRPFRTLAAPRLRGTAPL